MANLSMEDVALIDSDTLKIVYLISDEQNLRVTLKRSTEGGMRTGAAAFTGGVLVGPPDLPVEMALTNSDLLKIVSLISDEQNLKVTLNKSTECGITGAAAFIGGVLVGPPDLPVEVSLSNADIIEAMHTISKDNDISFKPNLFINIPFLSGTITAIFGALLGPPGLLGLFLDT